MSALRWFLALAAAALPALLAAQDDIPRARLADLKAGTVMVVVGDEQPICSGSGVMFGDATEGLLATNSHVVNGVPAASRKVTVVIDSGLPTETALPATVIADDPVDDVALLHIDAGARFRPLQLAAVAAPAQLSTVRALGYPFGDALALAAKHANVTITSGAVSSLHRDEAGVLRWIQIDADSNHGNSGGPAVDASGNVLGLVSAGVERTSVSLVIPVWVILEVVAGRACAPSWHTATGSTTWLCACQVVDPFHRIAALSMLIAPVSELEPEDPAAGAGAAQRRVKASVAGVELTLKDGVATATVPSAALAADGPLAAQFCYHDPSGERWSRPIVLTPPEGSTFPSAAGAAKSGASAASGGWLGKRADGSSVAPPVSSGAGGASGKVPTAPPAGATGDNAASAPSSSDPGTATARGVIPVGTATVAGAAERQGDLTVVPLHLSSCTSFVRFSSDGTSVLIESDQGILQRLDCATWKPLAACRIRPRALIIETGNGLAVFDDGHVDLLDPQTLASKLQFKTAQPVRLASASPRSKLLVCANDDSMTLYDVEKGQMLHTYRNDPTAPAFSSHPAHVAKPESPFDPVDTGPIARTQPDSGHPVYANPCLTGDGRFLFTVFNGTVHRYAVHGTSLHWEESSAHYDGCEVTGSDDGLYLAITGARASGSMTRLRIFRSTCLAWPLIAAEGEPQSAAFIAFDPANKRVLWLDFKGVIHQLAADGTPGSDHALTIPQRAAIFRMVASPNGSGVVIAMQHELYWITGL